MQGSQSAKPVAGLSGPCDFIAMDNITPAKENPYTGGNLDRAAHRREDEAWIEAAKGDAASRFVLFWQGKTLITGLEAREPRIEFLPRPHGEYLTVFLGLHQNHPVFAADISALVEPQASLSLPDLPFTDMRQITGTLPADDATILATARAMLHWHAKTGFCTVCGGRNISIRGGYVLHCTVCGTEHFPRTDPAVIMLVAKGDKILLGQSHKFPPERNFYSTLAGFVEPGESLEDAVRREVFEEVGVRVGKVAYHSSQPWPFPASLMLGYYAEALTEEITLETAEMRDARWFSPDDIENRRALGFNLPPHDSIARRLIEDWLNSRG
jgi:NAD+ diphosphatase